MRSGRLDLLQRSFPAQSGDRDTIVFQTTSGTVSDPAVRARMSSTLAAVARLPHVTAVISPYAASTGGRQISPDQKIAFATVVFDETASSLPGTAAKRVISVARAAQRPGPAGGPRRSRRSRAPSSPASASRRPSG